MGLGAGSVSVTLADIDLIVRIVAGVIFALGGFVALLSGIRAYRRSK
jgi:hypothetical protein